jgi:hypothetical protein
MKALAAAAFPLLAAWALSRSLAKNLGRLDPRVFQQTELSEFPGGAYPVGKSHSSDIRR